MRAVVQRVSSARVLVEGETSGSIPGGLCVLLAVSDSDGEKEVDWMADKIVNLRIFQDDEGKMNRSLLETGGDLLAVSQFTLYGDCRKGRRPSFVGAGDPEHADRLFEKFKKAVETRGVRVESGVFGAHMLVEIANDGPVTLIIDS
ncbi:MAG: D-tyrosyl-tRNA(Tyr) deacylase [Synergistaceae bacterium]|nr:D-aminoacyl-tRNA deacylase [Synergistota bacterium]NLM71680.1 D-tyrosyl-tRNA(Tyr) deacylase [Synergistaceae bacterium]